MSKLQVNDIVNKDDNGSPTFSKGAVVTGVCVLLLLFLALQQKQVLQNQVVH